MYSWPPLHTVLVTDLILEIFSASRGLLGLILDFYPLCFLLISDKSPILNFFHIHCYTLYSLPAVRKLLLQKFSINKHLSVMSINGQSISLLLFYLLKTNMTKNSKQLHQSNRIFLITRTTQVFSRYLSLRISWNLTQDNIFQEMEQLLEFWPLEFVDTSSAGDSSNQP